MFYIYMLCIDTKLLFLKSPSQYSRSRTNLLETTATPTPGLITFGSQKKNATFYGANL